MKPVQLVMEAFGSFGERTVIDFTKPNQNLFLVTGDTGAGKTTIFDALVFALYGEVSSSDRRREGKDLQSQYADLSVKPFVELTFSEAGDIYQVRRIPRHLRPLRRGLGSTEDRETVSLTLPDGSEYPEKLAETNEKIEAIVGLTRAQFLQVGMIAQGEFMHMLRVDSKERKEIFRRLFGTEIFMKVTEILKDRKKDAYAALDRVHAGLKNEVGQIRLPDKGENADMADLVRQVAESETPDVTDLEKLQVELSALVRSLKEEVKRTEDEAGAGQERRDASRDTLTKAEHLADQFSAVRSYREKMDKLHFLEPEMKAKKLLEERIKAAFEIKAVWTPFSEAEEDADRTERGLKEAQEALPGLADAVEDARKAVEDAHKERSAAGDAYIRQKEKTSRAIRLLADIRKEESETARLRKAWSENEKKGQEAAKATDEFEGQVREWNKIVACLAGSEVKKMELSSEKNKIRELLTRKKRLDREGEHVLLAMRQSESARDAYLHARDAYLRKSEEYRNKQNAYLDAQAGILALEKLREGEPCPVCGSLDHPHPCHLEGDVSNITRKDLEALTRELADCQKRQERAAAEAGRQQETVRQKTDSLLEFCRTWEQDLEAAGLDAGYDRCLRLSAPELSERDLASAKNVWEHISRELEAKIAVLEKEEKEAEQKCREFLDARQKTEGAEERRRQLRMDRETAEREAREAQMQLSAREGALQNLMAEREYAGEEEAQEALKRAEGRKRLAYARAAESERIADEAVGKKEQMETLRAHYTGILPAKRAVCEEKRRIYDNALESRGLSEPEWKSLAETYSDKDSDGLEKECRKFQDDLLRTEAAYRTAREAVGYETEPDLPALREKAVAADRELSEIQERLSALKNDLAADVQCKKRIETKMKERKRAKDMYTSVSSLYSRLAGQVSGGRMDLETYVQRCYLEKILHAANRRFKEMSFGQFELRMVSAGEAGRGKNRGLDLLVYSNVTGKEREIGTLSGGESFMAALSLALGMADQIQAASSSLHLDMMFIDEGFGSLDERARDQAVRVLQRMAGDRRLIGIISHVTELKQEIEDQLIVTRDEKGSHVRWQIS